MKLPSIRGLGRLPRYGGGWMHQFSHTYLLQQELLQKDVDTDWFRATELWHTARHEGLALNIAHYTNILQQCAVDCGGPWHAALRVLAQMRRDALRADCTAVGLALATCAKDRRWEEALAVFQFYSTSSSLPSASASTSAARAAAGAVTTGSKYAGSGLRMDSVCVAAVTHACVAAGRADRAAEFVASASASAAADQRRQEPGRQAMPSVDQTTVDAAVNSLWAMVAADDAASPSVIDGAAAPAVAAITSGEDAHDELQQQQEELVAVPAAQSSRRTAAGERTIATDDTAQPSAVMSPRRRQGDVSSAASGAAAGATESGLVWAAFFRQIGRPSA